MNNDQQRHYQPNLGVGTVSMLIISFAFALWVNSLEAPNVGLSHFQPPDRRSFITADPFARKIHVVGDNTAKAPSGKGKKIVVSRSGAGEDSSLPAGPCGDSVLKASAPPAFANRLDDWGNVIITLIDSRGIVDSALQVNPLAVLIQRRL